ncbi:MAG: T9SS type A sorting domain-containing protein [Bacteroidales bacterium]|nr:T9SS type A sorting domain-containing protein [Bacteroidales bacterium]
MRKLLTLLLLTLAINTFAQYTGNPFYFTFEVKNKEDIKRVTRIVSIENVKGTKVWAVLPWKDENKLKELGYTVSEYSIPSRDTKDYESRMTSSMTELLGWNKYPTYDLYVQFMEKMANDYPNLCKLVEIGTSEQGRKILCLRISDNAGIDEAEPEIYYTSTMHGDETTGFYLMMRYTHYLLSNYNTDAAVKELVDNTETWINPVSNPDGTYFGGNNTVFKSQRYTSKGIDMNRNFPEITTGESHPTGTWAKETIVQMDWMKTRNLVLSANFHGGIEVVNYPLDNKYDLHPDNEWYKYVSHNYANQAMADSPDNPYYFKSLNSNGITNGAQWYIVAGGRQDWVTLGQGCREITIELSDTKCLAESELNKHWTYNKNALLNYHKEILKGFYGVIVDALTNQPVKAKIQMIPNVQYSEISTDNLGFFQRMISAGTHKIKVVAEGYISKELTVSTSTNQGTNLGIIKLIKIDSEAGIVLSETNGSTITSEQGSSDDINVCLSKAPTSNVILTINVGNTSEGKTDKSTLIFTKDNWYIDQPITITGLPDNLIDGDTKYDLTISVDKENSDALYAEVKPVRIGLTNIDLTIELDILTQESENSTITSEDGELTDIIKVYLNKRPAGNVTIKITVSDPSEGKTDISEIVFNKNTWDIKTPVTVTGISDDEKDGDVEYYITFDIDESQTDANIHKTDSKKVKVINRDKVATSINNNENVEITVYPNPADNNISINCSTENFNFIKIINTKGIIIKSQEFECVNNKTINISELSSGIYIIEFGNDQRKFSRKFYKN